MDVSIGHLRLVGRLVGAPDRAQTAAVVEQLTGTAARERLLDQLGAAFDGEEVLVFRSLDCTATLRRDGDAAEALARTITASAARLLREHPADDDHVVRFPDEAAYVAAYVHDYLDGRHDRWYYEAFEPYRRRDGTVDLAALLAAHRLALRLRILAAVRRAGELDALLDRVGERADEVVANGARPARSSWSPLVAAALSVVSAAVGGAAGTAGAGLVERLAKEEPPPDWRDAASLGDAVAAAVVAIVRASQLVPSGDLVARLVSAAAEHEWFDVGGFERGLSARLVLPPPLAAPTPAEPALSPRVRQVLASLAVVAADNLLRLDPSQPTSSANRLRLLAALVDLDQQWDDDDLARTLADQVLDRWAAATRVAPEAGTPGARQALRGPVAGPDDDARARGGVEEGTGRPAAPAPDVRPTASPHVDVHPAIQAVVDVLPDRFPGTAQAGGGAESAAAAGLLVLRGALDLGLAPYLLDPTASGRSLLGELLDRWSEAEAADADPLHDVVAQAADSGERRSRLDQACRLAGRRLVGLGHVAEPFWAVTVPHGAADLLTVIADETGRLLPWGSLAGRAGLGEPLAEAQVELAGESDATDVRASVSAVLSSVCRATGEADEHSVDLLAIACVQAWARWLPGFAGSSVPFLLDTVVRRAAHVGVTDDEITVALSPRSHDVVLSLAGYLEPVEPGPLLGGRRVRFLTGSGHGS